MPFFSRLKHKVSSAQRTKGDSEALNGSLKHQSEPKFQSTWNSSTIVPHEVQELIHACTLEMKSRAEALDAPFLLLPFRPDADASSARIFIRNFYKSNAEGLWDYRGPALQQELRLTEPVALCSIIKWCWSRMPGGVVSWPVYEGFQIGEREANMTRNAFTTFIPISAESLARRSIIFDFFDLMAAVAARGKLNGLGGRKLSRLAGWWAFEHSDDGKGFEGGYKSWQSAADATSHMFFAYLRSLSPEADPQMSVIERIPRSLQALLASTEYPPETPTLLQHSTARVLMLVDEVSPTPFALIRRAKQFEYRDNDRVLREYSEFEDPIDALTEESKRVLYAVSSTNSASVQSRHRALAKPDESWSAFQDLGFADMDEKAVPNLPNGNAASVRATTQSLRSEPRSRNADYGRPTTPSWADFMSAGFEESDIKGAPPQLLLPPQQVLPPLVGVPPAPQPEETSTLPPGEVAAITSIELDDAFWWVWMTSLASEEPSQRKAVFGRCALIETTIMNGKWLIMEEQVKGASPGPAAGIYVAPKKSFFGSLAKRSMLGRKRSTLKSAPASSQNRLERVTSAPSKTSLAPDQHSKIKQAAAALARQQNGTETETSPRRGRVDDPTSSKTNSVLTIGLQSEAGPAMKWTSAYDKNAIRAQYLGDIYAGKGYSREDILLRKASSTNINSNGSESPAGVSPVIPASAELPASPITAKPGPEAHPVELEAEAPKAQEQDLATALQPTSPKRKPVPNSDEHPAHRQQSLDEPMSTKSQSPVNSRQTAASVAAARAMQNVSQVGQNPPVAKKQENVPARKKLFVRRGDVNPPSNAQDGVNDVFGAPIDTLREKKATTKASDNAALAAQAAVDRSNIPSALPAGAARQPYNTSDVVTDSAPVDIAAEHEFSRFDQGRPVTPPLLSAQDAVSAQEQVDQSYPPYEKSAGFVDNGRHDDIERMQTDTVPETRQSNASQDDRWAAIRENAARRAAQESDGHSTHSRQSQSARTDDGETSGEETIESRVARIKARVAELTGGIDSSSTRR